MRRVFVLLLVGLFFFALSFFLAYKLFSLPQLKLSSELVCLRPLLGLGFFYAPSFWQGLASPHVE